MASVYILYSKKGDHFYSGSCKELQFRIQEHIERIYKESYTAKFDDWELFLEIPNLDYEQARAIEKHIKSMKSKKYIRDLAKYNELQQRLIERYKTK